MNRRAYAITLGLAIPGRGRLSRAAIAACDAAAIGGMVFSEPTTSVAAPRTAKSKHKASQFTQRREAVQQTEEAEEFNVQDRTSPAGSMWVSESGHKVNETQVCSPCGFSLGWHRCNHPSAVVGSGVLESVRPV